MGADVRGDPASSALILFWGAAAVVVGPLVGLAASWVRHGRDELVAVGIGALSGVLLGEGVYGLAYISGTTSTTYWWAEVVVAVLVLGGAAAWRLPRPQAVAIAGLMTGGTAAAFVVVYRLDLISVLP